MEANRENDNQLQADAENERLRFALEAAGIGTWDLNPIKNMVAWDDRCRALFGFAPGETVAYEQVLRYMHPDDAATVHEAVQEALDPASENDYEVRYRTIGAADGKLRWVLSKGKAYFNDEGIAYRFAGTAQDITEAVVAQERTKASEQIAQVALENSNSGYFRISLADDTLECSPGYAKILTGDADTSRSYDAFMAHLHPDDQSIHLRAHAAAAATGELYYEARTIWDDGSIYWIRTKGTCISDAAGRPALLTGTVHDITAEKKAEEDIAAARHMADIAIRSSGIGIFRIDLTTGLVACSPAFAAIMTGDANKQGFTRHTFIEYVHPDDQQMRRDIVAVAIKTGSFFYEPRVIWDDGTVHRIHVSGACLFDDSGKPLALSGALRDITAEAEQKQALQKVEDRLTQALRQSERIFRSVADSSPTGLWLSDETGGLIYLNKTLAEWAGRPYETLLGAGWADVVFEEDRPRTVEVYTAALQARMHYDILFRIVKANGSTVWTRTAGDPYYNEDGSYAGYAGFCLDIDEIIRGKEALQASEANFRSLVENTPDAITRWDKDLRLIFANSPFAQKTGQAIAELTGKTNLEMSQPAAIARPYMAQLQEVLDSGIPQDHYHELPTPDGRASYHSRLVPEYDADGTVQSVLSIARDITALKESEERFRALIEEAPVATCLFTGREMRIEVANDVMCSYWGKDASVIGKPLTEAVPELTGQSFPAILEKVFETGITYVGKAEHAELMVDGVLSSYYFDYTYKPLKNAAGEVYGIIDMAVDVTEQVKAIQQLEESELFSRNIIDNSPVAKIIFIGEDMVIERVNQNMLALIGRDASVVGMSLAEAMPELAGTGQIELLRGVFFTGETFYQPEEKIELVKFGKPYTGYYSYIHKALYNTADEIYGVVVTATEVTDQVLARQQIEEAETRLRGAIELAELGTWTYDLRAGVLDYSPRLRSWMGFGATETITRETAYRPVPEAHRPRVREAILQAIAPGSDGVYDIEYPLDPAGARRERIIHVQGKAFFDEHGEAYKMTGTAQDVTAQRKIQLALEQEVQERTEELAATNEELQAINEELAKSNDRLLHSNEELAQYAYVASHDLQEPLRKIRMFSGMLESRDQLPEESRMLVEKISQSSSRMTLLIRDLLEFSRLLKSETLVRPVDLNETVAAIVSDFELTIEEKKAIITVGRLPLIEAIGLQMNQLFYNLLGNALKFNRQDIPPVVRIVSEMITHEAAAKYIPKPWPAASYYHIRISDNGIGFEVKYSEQIFEVFKRLHGRDSYPGSGIGLALCRRIVANHHGALYAESVEGTGSTFHLILPDTQQDDRSPQLVQ